MTELRRTIKAAEELECWGAGGVWYTGWSEKTPLRMWPLNKSLKQVRERATRRTGAMHSRWRGSKALRQDRASKKLEEQKRGQLGEAAERNKQGG